MEGDKEEDELVCLCVMRGEWTCLKEGVKLLFSFSLFFLTPKRPSACSEATSLQTVGPEASPDMAMESILCNPTSNIKACLYLLNTQHWKSRQNSWIDATQWPCLSEPPKASDGHTEQICVTERTYSDYMTHERLQNKTHLRRLTRPVTDSTYHRIFVAVMGARRIFWGGVPSGIQGWSRAPVG